MACIRQYQRRAIESLATYVQEVPIHSGQRFFLGEDEIFLLGISRGVGTCSDLKGVDFAVFGTIPNGYYIDGTLYVAGCVFLRNGKENMQIVESLVVYNSQIDHSANSLYLQKNGHSNEYVVTIC